MLATRKIMSALVIWQFKFHHNQQILNTHLTKTPSSDTKELTIRLTPQYNISLSKSNGRKYIIQTCFDINNTES